MPVSDLRLDITRKRKKKEGNIENERKKKKE
jgi:hypothetical protein